MSVKVRVAFSCLLLSALLVSGCQSSNVGNSTTTTTTTTTTPAGARTTETAKTGTTSATPDPEGIIPSGTGTEKEKPAPGKGNVQGKVFYNEKPAEGIEVKLCEKFSRFIGGCSGESFTAKTDAAGEYLIKDVPPRVYEGLVAKVFNTNYYVFATSGIVQSAKYKVDADKTFFAPDTHLFKQDLKLTSPKAGSKVAGEGIEVKWEPYPDAAYYKFSIFADSSSGATPNYDYINRRVEGQSFALDKPLGPGSYSVRVEAYNGNDIRLAQSSGDIKFAVTGDAAK